MPARQSEGQRKTMGRVMHEYAHGELKSGRSGKGGKVKSRRQAIAIALKEAGASKYESANENRRNLKRSKRKESEGKRRIGARGRRESSRAMGGKNARKAAPRTAKQLAAARRNIRKARRAA